MGVLKLNDVEYTAGGASSLDVLNDVSITNPTDGQIITYNSTLNKWENGEIPSSTTLTQTLTAGQTTVTFTDASILATSLISVYADVWYSNSVQSEGSVVLTFPVQASDMVVKIKVG